MLPLHRKLGPVGTGLSNVQYWAPHPMKAIVQDKYGSAGEVLKLQDIAKPLVKDDEVLVRVHAASIHIGDVILVRGLPYFLRMATGVRKPKNPVPGTDIAGTVEAVGKDVTHVARRCGSHESVDGWIRGAADARTSIPERLRARRPRATQPPLTARESGGGMTSVTGSPWRA